MNCKQHTTEHTGQLKKGKLKVTPGRLHLLDVFAHAKKPLSVKDVQDTLGKKVDKVTVYRNVESLENLGLVKKIQLGDRQAYYELTDQHHHHHLVCKRCGKMTDVTGCQVTTARNFLKNTGFAEVTDHSLEFFGICNSCAK